MVVRTLSRSKQHRKVCRWAGWRLNSTATRGTIRSTTTRPCLRSPRGVMTMTLSMVAAETTHLMEGLETTRSTGMEEMTSSTEMRAQIRSVAVLVWTTFGEERTGTLSMEIRKMTPFKGAPVRTISMAKVAMTTFLARETLTTFGAT